VAVAKVASLQQFFDNFRATLAFSPAYRRPYTPLGCRREQYREQESSDMARLESSIEIGKAPRQVFAFAAMPAQMQVWMSGVLMTTCAGAEAIGTGSRFQQHWKLLGQVIETIYEVLEYDPDHALAYQGIAGPVCCLVRCSFTPLATGTRLTWCSDVDLRTVFHQQAPLAACVAQRLLEADLLTLKAVLEWQ
jgi:uncharacterized protein YndB with AHSA1/START domain